MSGSVGVWEGGFRSPARGHMMRATKVLEFHARGEFEGGLGEEDWERLRNGRPDLRSVRRVLSVLGRRRERTAEEAKEGARKDRLTLES